MKLRFLPLLLMLVSMLSGMTACNDDDGPVIAQYLEIVRRLPAYYKLNSENTLIPTDGYTDENVIAVLNTTDEVRSYIGEDFLQANQDYLNIDFNQYSLIVKTSYRFPYVINPNDSEYSIIYNPYRENWQFTENVYVTDTLDNDWYVERIALVVEKISSDTHFSYICNKLSSSDISTSPNN